MPLQAVKVCVNFRYETTAMHQVHFYKNSPRFYNYLNQVVAATLIFVFAYTAFSKLADLSGFQRNLMTSPILKEYFRFFAMAIPAVELLLTLLLMVPSLRWWGLAGSFVLLLLFTGYIAGMMLWAPELPCSCGGIVQQLSWWQHLGVNLMLAGLTFWALLTTKNTIAIDRESRKPENRVGNYSSTKNFYK